MKSRRIRTIVSLFTIAAMLLTFTPVNAAENGLKEGDYVKFGTYHGAAILWRVVDLDEDGDPMLLSDQIITNKPFNLYSNCESCWEVSYIRSWLNSEAGEGQVKYGEEESILAYPLDPGVWDVDVLKKEAGFLSPKNFTSAEIGILKESKQKDTLIGKYMAGKEGGSKEYYIDYNLWQVDQAAAIAKNAYYKYVTDRMFVMDIIQLNDVYKKFGDYAITTATYESLQYEKNAKTEYIDHYYNNSGTKEIPLAKPVESSAQYVRNFIARSNSAERDYALIGIGYTNMGALELGFGSSGGDNLDITGVRPACYVDMSKTSIASGSGSKDDPYRFDAKNIYGNTEALKPQPVRVVGMWSRFIKFTDASGMPFVDSASRTQVPLRVTMENLYAKVTWDSSSKTAIVEKNGIKVEVPVGKNYIVVNGVQQTIDTSAQIVNGKTYLPIKSVVVALGGEVSWDPSTKTVIITIK